MAEDKIAKILEKTAAANKAQAIENAQIQAELANKKFDADKARGQELINAVKNSSREDKASRIKELKAFKSQQAKDKKRDDAIDSNKSQERIKLEENQAKLAELKSTIEASGRKAEENKEFNKASLTVQNEEFDLRKKESTSPSAKKEIEKERRKANEGQETLLGKLGNGISDLVDQGKQGFEAAKKGGMAILKGTAMAALFFGIAAFLKSEYFVKALDFIEKEVLPALKFLYEKVLKPIGEAIFEIFVKQFETVGELFDNIGESIQMFKDGDILGGINGIINSLGTFIIDSIDNVITGIFNLFAKMFGMEETDSVFGSISKFFTDMFNDIKNFFTTLVTDISNFFTTRFDAFMTTIKTDFESMWEFVSKLNVFKYVTAVLGDMLEGIKGIFSGDFSAENFGKIFGSLFDIAFSGLNLVINSIMDIFGLGEDKSDFGQKTPFRLSEFIVKKIRDIIAVFTDWFSNIKIPSVGDLISMAATGFSKIGSFLTGGEPSKEEKLETLYKKQQEEFEKIAKLGTTGRQKAMQDPDSEYNKIAAEIDSIRNEAGLAPVEKTGKFTQEELDSVKGAASHLTPFGQRANFTSSGGAPSTSALNNMKKQGIDGQNNSSGYAEDISATPTSSKGGTTIINAPTTTNAPVNNNSTTSTVNSIVESDPMFNRLTQFAL